MSKSNWDDAHWESCPPGMLANVALRRRTDRRKLAVLQRVALAVVVVAVGAGVLWGVYPAGDNAREYHFGGIACSEVQRLIPRYMDDDLEADIRPRVEQHLAECPQCAERLRMMESQMGELPRTAIDAWANHQAGRGQRELSWLSRAEPERFGGRPF